MNEEKSPQGLQENNYQRRWGNWGKIGDLETAKMNVVYMRSLQCNGGRCYRDSVERRRDLLVHIHTHTICIICMKAILLYMNIQDILRLILLSLSSQTVIHIHIPTKYCAYRDSVEEVLDSKDVYMDFKRRLLHVFNIWDAREESHQLCRSGQIEKNHSTVNSSTFRIFNFQLNRNCTKKVSETRRTLTGN